MTQNSCPQNIWNHTSGCTCAPNGTITAEVDIDLDAFASEAKETADRLRRDADAHVALAQRIEVYSLLKDYPSGYQVETMLWPEDANADGTFDVNLGAVLDADGNEVENFEGNPGGIPAGWDDGFQPRTAFDCWRVPSTDPKAPISVGMMHAWFQDYQAYRASETKTSVDADVERASNEIGTLFERLRTNATGSTSTGRTIGGVNVGVSFYGLKDSDGYAKPRGTNGDVTLISNEEVRTFPFGAPSDPDNHETFEGAQAAAAKALAEMNR